MIPSPTRALALPAALLATLLAGGTPAAEAAPRGPAVHVRTLERGALQGVLTGLDDTSLRLREAGAAEDRALPLSGVIDVLFPAGLSAKRVARPAADAGDDVRLRAVLVGGEILVGTYRGPAAEGIRLEVHGLGSVALTFETIHTLEATRPLRDGRTPMASTRELRQRYPRPKNGDLAYDEGDDEYAGSVVEATATALVMEGARGRRRSIPWGRLRVVHLENDAPKPVEGLRAEIELTEGSRITTAGALAFSEKGLRFALRSVPEKTWAVPFSTVHTVRWSGGAFVYATEVPFRAVYTHYYEDPPGTRLPEFYESHFGARVNGRSKGGPLRLGGRTYRYGFGVNSRSTITLDLKGGYRSFRAGFGIDDSVLEEKEAGGKRGNVEARVLGDGKVLWKAADVEAGQPVLKVGPVDVSGVKELVLEVGYGKASYGLDRGDWVDPILVRK